MSQDIEIKAGMSRQSIEVMDPIPLLDTGHFEQMQRLANLLAESTLIPDSLRMTVALNEDGWPIARNGKNLMVELPHRSVVSNCFLVVEQAVRWGMSPFGVAQCVSVVHGRLCYEGKLVAGVLDAKLGIELDYQWNSQSGDDFGVKVSARTSKRGEVKSIAGTVGEWKTTGNNSPWAKPANHHRMLAYRGAREWARIYKPSLMLGVYTSDEIEALDARRSIAPVQHALGRPQPSPSEPGTASTALPAYVRPDDPESQPAASPVDPDKAKFEAEHEVIVANIDARMQTREEAGPVEENPTSPDSPSESPTPTSTATPPEQTVAGSMALPEPTEAAEYESYWFAWVAMSEDRGDCIAEWNSQRKLRNRLHVPMEMVDRCKALIEATFPKEPA